MKKLMVMAAVAMAAVCSQAASIKWSIGDGSATAQDGYLVYLVTSAGAFDTIDALKASALAVTVGTNTGAIEAGRRGETLEGASGNTAWADGQAVDFYFAILNATTEGAATGYWITDKMTATAVDSGAPTSVDFDTLGSLATPAKLHEFAAVPEPTSGLLLLLGVAGLALRRRRA